MQRALLVPASRAKWSMINLSPLVVFEDPQILVLYKPATVLMQGGDGTNEIISSTASAGDDNLLDGVKRYLSTSRDASSAYAGLVHRLDRGVSGLCVFAKSSKSLAKLNEAFRERMVDKSYICVVNGHISPPTGRLQHMLAKTQLSNNKARVLPANSTAAGVDAQLTYEVLRLTDRKQSLVKVQLLTGRKHQIRAQFAAVGHPIVGDVKYGAPQRFQLRDLALHSYRLALMHPVSQQRLVFADGPPSSWESRFGPDVTEAINQLVRKEGT